MREKVLITALYAAIEAGDYFKSRIDTELQVKTKTSPSDLVTDVDPYCEQLIRNAIHRAFPEHTILGEETTEPGADAASAAVSSVENKHSLWIIDPLDGTNNFVAGIPLSVVSIGYASQGQLQAGVIYDPYRQELFFALRGKGAYRAVKTDIEQWLNQTVNKETVGHSYELPGSRLSVSEETELNRAVAATGFPVRRPEQSPGRTRGLEIASSVKSLRALGAAALHLAYVAAGRIDVFWEYDLNVWDLAAGVLLVTEAGGTVSEIGGDKYTLAVRDIVASGKGQLADSVRQILWN